MRLTDFKVLTFDCYGTLIDWETGILRALGPLRERAGATEQPRAVLGLFAEFEGRQQEAAPGMLYPDILAAVHDRLAEHWGVAPDAAESARFGASIGDWLPFPDTSEALARLKRHYALVILSNVDRASFARTNARLGVAFDAIYTAQDIGSYKPDPRNFEYLIARLGERGFAKSDILHTAQSLFHDHAVANRIGLASCWIDRRGAQEGWGATLEPPAEVRYDFRFPTLAAMADALDLELPART
jgi:2-haloacid dehalogenase